MMIFSDILDYFRRINARERITADPFNPRKNSKLFYDNAILSTAEAKVISFFRFVVL